MDLKEYISPLIRWWWLIALSAVIALGTSFVANLGQPEIYQSKTTLMIGQTINDPNPTTGEFYLAEQLASSYADIANREPVQNAAMEALGLPFLPSYQAKALTNSQLIEIAVVDTNPVRAQAVANELARQLTLRSPANASPANAERQQFLNDQLDRLQEQISETQAEIERLQLLLPQLTSARQIADTQGQINTLQPVLNNLQTNYANLLSNTQQGAVNTITVIEPANLPVRPIGPNRLASVLLAGAVGAALAAAAAYAIEFIDDTLKSEEEVSRLVSFPIIGQIPDVTDNENIFTYVSQKPRSITADAYRLLRVNLEYSSIDRPPKVFMVASTSSEEGKSTIATNLALIMAQAQRKVTLIDADFRRPSIKQALDINHYRGLSDVFRGSLTLWEAVTPLEEKLIMVLPTGRIPPNPMELLGSEKMDQILASIKDISDVVVIDAPPFLVPDASILAAKVDGVIIVTRLGHTRKAALKQMINQIKRVGTPVLGVVINRVNPRSSYYAYYDAREEPPSKTKAAQSQGLRRIADLVKRIQGSSD